MRVTPTTPNFSQKSNVKNNQPAFGNFVKVEIPGKFINVPESLRNIVTLKPSKEYINEALRVVTNIANAIKEVTQRKVNVYRRTLDDMGFREKHGNDQYRDFSKTFFIEDNNGKNLPELLDTVGYLTEKLGFHSKVYSGDLFAPLEKPKNIGDKIDQAINGTILNQVAYGAKPEQMIKL